MPLFSRSNRVFLLGALLLLQSLAAGPMEATVRSAATACTKPTETSLVRVENLLQAVRTWDFPGTRAGELTRIEPMELRLLERGEDEVICRRIRELALADRPADRATGLPWLVSVYEAGGYYFASGLKPVEGGWE